MKDKKKVSKKQSLHWAWLLGGAGLLWYLLNPKEERGWPYPRDHNGNGNDPNGNGNDPNGNGNGFNGNGDDPNGNGQQNIEPIILPLLDIKFDPPSWLKEDKKPKDVPSDIPEEVIIKRWTTDGKAISLGPASFVLAAQLGNKYLTPRQVADEWRNLYLKHDAFLMAGGNEPIIKASTDMAGTYEVAWASVVGKGLDERWILQTPVKQGWPEMARVIMGTCLKSDIESCLKDEYWSYYIDLICTCSPKDRNGYYPIVRDLFAALSVGLRTLKVETNIPIMY